MGPKTLGKTRTYSQTANITGRENPSGIKDFKPNSRYHWGELNGNDFNVLWVGIFASNIIE
jgi:hypothetical protein